jgi:1-phosphofructokinase
VPKSISTSIYADILKITSKNGVKTILDASGALLWNALEYKPFLIKPNHHELGEIFNREIEEREEVIFYAKELQNRGAKNVLVSMGANGAVLIAEDGKVYEEDAPQGIVQNAVGAGDSMVAGFIAGYIDGNEDYKKALRMGVATGSASAFSLELATREEVLNLCKLMDFKN